MEVKLDKAALKALSNDTRVGILKELQRRRYTQSELAEELGLSVPTVKEHLVALGKAGLVEMHDEGRKWKYYSLTGKSKAILQPESVSIFIVLGTFILSVIGGVYSYIISMRLAAESFAMEKGVAANDMVATEAIRYAAPVGPSFFQLYGVWIFSAIAIISAILFIYFMSKRMSRLGKILNKK
ncbi:winged helix-turn-helix domain-containing protein [Candidatus Woesearchaeota archaeon]|nr:winged helix-turn-helix domain-containing protein [Candidatus Woesearchaeota archaeon]